MTIYPSSVLKTWMDSEVKTKTKTTMSYQLTALRKAVIQKTESSRWRWGRGREEMGTPIVEMYISTAAAEINKSKIDRHMIQQTATEYSPKRHKHTAKRHLSHYVEQHCCEQPKTDSPRWPLSDEWINEIWYI